MHSGLLGVLSISARELQQGVVRRALYTERCTAVCDQVWVRGTVVVAAGDGGHGARDFCTVMI